MDDWSSRHFNVAETLRHAREFVDFRRGDSDALPRAGADDWSFTSFYNPVTDTISLNASDHYEDTTLLHEYAHHLEHKIGTFLALPSTHGPCVATFGPIDVRTAQFAWMEGFANWFARAAASFAPAHARRENMPGTPAVATLESPSCPGLPAGVTPDETEIVVAGALWDLFDDTPGEMSGGVAFDRLFGFDRTVMQIFDKEMDLPGLCTPLSLGDCPSIHDFRRAWMNRNLPGAALGRIWATLGIPFVDNFPPAANAGADRALREGVLAVLDGTASEDPELGPLNFSWTQTGGPAVTLSNPTIGTPTFTVPSSPGAVLTFRLVVSDGTQSSGPDFVTITVTDGTPPVLSLPASPVVAEATGPSDAAVPFTVTATDNFDPNPTVSCNPAPGSVFPLGATMVSCSATDAAGNSANAAFTVKVVDTTPPTFPTPPADVTVEATSPSGAVVTYSLPAATDLVDPSPTVECAPPSGNVFPLGTTTVGCTALDFSGNLSPPALFEVNVVDTTPPVLTVADLTLNATSPAGAPLAAYPAAAVSAADIADLAPAISCAPAAPFTFPIGMTTVTCTAADASGNTSAPGSFVVTVKGAAEQTGDLVSDVEAAALPEGVATSLEAKLDDLDSLPVSARCGRLKAFANQVEALAGISIPADTAARWIEDAERIRAVLGCATAVR